MSGERLAVDAEGKGPLLPRRWVRLSNDQLLDRLEGTYGESGAFETEVVWELARRVQTG